MVTKEDIKDIPEFRGAMPYIIDRYRKGLLNAICFYGPPGMGKSYSGLRLMELIYPILHNGEQIPKNYIKTFLVQKPAQFVKAVKIGKRGDIILLEEFSTWMNSRRSMTKSNVNMSAIFDTIRKKGIILITNSPSIKNIDKSVFPLMSLAMKVMSLNKSEGICKIAHRRLQYNYSFGKMYYHKFRNNSNGFDIDFAWSGTPNPEFTKEYEQMKDTNMDELYDRIEAEEMAIEDKVPRGKVRLEIMNSKDEEINKIKYLRPAQRRACELYIQYMDLKNVDRIKKVAELTGLTERSIYDSINRAKQNGVRLWMFENQK